MRDPLLHFQRINVTLDETGLAPLEMKGLTAKVIENTRGLDNAAKANLDRLDAIGIAAGKRMVKPEHFPAIFDPVYG